MARKKSSVEVSISHQYGSTLFERLQLPKLRNLFEHLYPSKTITQRGSTAILMNCVSPHHVDRNPSMYVYPSSNLAICLACGYRTRNLLEMLAVSLGLSYSESLIRIQEVTGVRVATEAVAKQLDKLDIYHHAARLFAAATNEYLQKLVIYSIGGVPVTPEDASYYTPAVLHQVNPVLDWLFQQRKLNPDYVQYLPYGVLPTLELFKKLFGEELDREFERATAQAAVIPARYTKERREKLIAQGLAMYQEAPPEFLGAVVFAMGYSPSTVGRIRLRKVIRSTGTDYNFFDISGVTSGAPLGYLGLFSNSHGHRRISGDHRVIMVESEISMLVLQQELLARGIPNVSVVASAGANNETDLLYDAGYQNVDLLMDHPDPALGKGEDQVKLKLSSAQRIQPRVFIAWDALQKGVFTVKDPDDALQAHGWDHVAKLLIDDADKTFVPSNVWAAERAIEAGVQIPETNLLARQSCAVEYGKCVRQPTLLSAFVTQVSNALGLPPGPLRAAIVSVKDDEAGLLARIVETLKSDFVVLHKNDSIRAGTLTLFHKQQRRSVTINVNEGSSIVTALSNFYGEMYSYVVNNIGIPGVGVEENENKASISTIRDSQKFLADYYRIAFQSIYQGVLDERDSIQLGPGIHFYPAKDGEPYSIARIHNANQWFKLYIPHDTTQRVRVEELGGPVDGEYAFRPTDQPWSSCIVDAASLEATNDIPLELMQSTFRRIRAAIDAAWKFRHQDADTLFATALLFVIAAGGAFDIKLIVRILGESNSGKSTLMSLYCRGQYPSIVLCEASGYSSNYTTASLYHEFNDSRLTMALDEASQDHKIQTQKTRQMEDINEMIRQIAFEGGVSVNRVGPNGKVVKYRLHTNVLMTTVTEPRDHQESNRSYFLETVREVGRRDPQHTLNAILGAANFPELRRIIQIGILKYLPRLHKSQKEFYTLFNEKQIASFTVPSRFLRNFAPIGAVLDLMGYDALAEIRKMIETRKDRILAQDNNSASKSTLDQLLRGTMIEVPTETGLQTKRLLSVLIEPNAESVLREADLGIYYAADAKLLAIDMTQAFGNRGFFSKQYDGNQSVVSDTFSQYTLRTALAQSPNLVPQAQWPRYNIPDRFWQMGKGAPSNLIVLDVSTYIASALTAPPGASKPPGGAKAAADAIALLQETTKDTGHF